MTEKIICKSKISKNFQTTVQREARTMLDLKAGDTLLWILKNGNITVKKGHK